MELGWGGCDRAKLDMLILIRILLVFMYDELIKYQSLVTFKFFLEILNYLIDSTAVRVCVVSVITNRM